MHLRRSGALDKNSLAKSANNIELREAGIEI